MNEVDWKFRIHATALHNAKVYTEQASVLFLCKDLAFLPALRFYRGECERIGAASAQLRGIDLLIGRVEEWQREHPDLLKVPDIEGDEALVPPHEWSTEKP